MHTTNCSSEGVDGNQGKELDLLFRSSDWKTWKGSVNQALHDFKIQVSELQQQKKSLTSMTKSFPPSGLPTYIRMTRSEKMPMFQCIWLLCFVVAVTTVGIIQFQRVLRNTGAEFKPQRKVKTIDYESTVSEDPWEMPYTYITFGCHWTYGYTSFNQNLDEVVERLLQSQNYFEDAATVIYPDMRDMASPLQVEEAEAFLFDHIVGENYFYGYFRVKLSSPDSRLGRFWYTLSLDTNAMTLNKLWITDLQISVSRDATYVSSKSNIYLSAFYVLQHQIKLSIIIDYVEKVVDTWSNEQENEITSFLMWKEERVISWVDYDYGLEEAFIVMTFRPDFTVDYWEEYIAYGWYDWFAGMGGFVSILSLIFFKSAFFMALKFGEKGSMGILPKMDFVFAMYEALSFSMKKQEE